MEQTKTKVAKASKKVPLVADLLEGSGYLESAFKNDQLNHLLNQNPPEGWVMDHPFAKNEKGLPIKYIPIEKVEFLLRRIFKRYRVEVMGYSALFNSVACHVRVHYLNPVNGEWDYQDGVGAVGMQVDKGHKASDMNAIKKEAVMMALPSAKSYAIKDALEILGSLFGANLNRKDVVGFIPDEEVINREELRKQKLMQHGISIQ